MPRCFVSIGSNIDRERHIAAAVRGLERLYGPLALSRVYESAPVGFRGENFYNLAAGFETEEPLAQVLARLLQIEAACGRRRNAKAFESRTLDMDLLLYGDLCCHEGEIDIPRPEIAAHAFVLRPLSEIAPELVHPETGKTIAAMWRQFKHRGQDLWPAACALGLKQAR